MDILVDLDGTLIDPKPGILGSIRYALEALGAPVPPVGALTWAIGPPLRTTFPLLLGDALRTEEAIALYRDNFRNGAMFDGVVYAGIPQALADLRAAGCRLIVATAKPHHFARPILTHFDLAHHFANIYGPELDGTNDRKADLIAHIIAQERIDPASALMIGDREHDVLAATRNGMRAIGVTWGYGSIAELTAAGATTICTSPQALAAAALELMRGGMAATS